MATLSNLRRAAPLGLGLLLTGCGLFGGGQPRLGEPVPQKPVVGFVVTPVPQASLAARRVLSEGGNAVDAATAAGFALAVTLPSRAGLGGGGACLIDLPKPDGGTGRPVTLLFEPKAPPQVAGDVTRPAAVPELARGLVAMQARYGRLSLAADIAPAEAMAGGGVAVSRSLAADFAVVGDALLADPAARAVFAAQDGAPLAAGAIMRQPDLAASLTALQSNGVLGFDQGRFAARFIKAADRVGAGLTRADLLAVRPRYVTPLSVGQFGDQLYFTPTAGGIGAMAGIEALAQRPGDVTMAGARALAAAKAARHGAGMAALPASAGFAALDDRGGSVGCVTTMNNLFGNGRVAPGTGILLAASPAGITPPLLAVGLAKRDGKFRAIATGSGQLGAPMAVAAGLTGALSGTAPMPRPVPAPGRAAVIACSGLLPGAAESCGAAADPRGFGLAVGTR